MLVTLKWIDNCSPLYAYYGKVDRLRKVLQFLEASNLPIVYATDNNYVHFAYCLRTSKGNVDSVICNQDTENKLKTIIINLIDLYEGNDLHEHKPATERTEVAV